MFSQNTIFISLILIPFLYLNYKIIVSDCKNKIIPNKYLGYLLLIIPLWWGLLFFGIKPGYLPGFLDINPLVFGLEIIFTFIISFILYYFGIWASGDAKYVLILSLFIPYIGIIAFIGNIALITIFYLIGYFLWFWFIKNIVKKERIKTFSSVKLDSLNYIKNKKNNLQQSKITFFLSLFNILAIFVCMRLFRISAIKELKLSNSFMSNFLSENPEMLILLLIGITFLILIIAKALYNFVSRFFSQRLGITKEKGKIYFLLLGNIIFIVFLLTELLGNFHETIYQLKLISTFYLLIFISIKVLIYMYKVSFIQGSSIKKSLNQIKPGDMVDYIYFLKKYGYSKKLGFIEFDERSSIKDTGPFSPDPKVFIKSLRGGIKQKKIAKLQEMLSLVGENHIKVYSTFSFGFYIFCGFCISILFTNSAVKFLIEYFVNLFFKNV